MPRPLSVLPAGLLCAAGLCLAGGCGTEVTAGSTTSTNATADGNKPTDSEQKPDPSTSNKWSIKATINAMSGDPDAGNAASLPPTLLVVEVGDAAAALAGDFAAGDGQPFVRAIKSGDCAVAGGKPALPCSYTFADLDLSAYTGGAMLRAYDSRPSRSGPDWQSAFAFVSAEALVSARGGAPAPAAVTVWSGAAASAVAVGLQTSLPDMFERGGLILHFVSGAASSTGVQLTAGLSSAVTATYPTANLAGKQAATSSLGLALVTPMAAQQVSTSGWVGTAGAVSYPVPKMTSAPGRMLFAQVEAAAK